MFLVSTSPGARAGINSLNYMKGLVPFHGAKLVDTCSIPNFMESFPEGKATIETNKILQHFVKKIKNSLE